MEIVTYSETRANLKAIMDRVVEDHNPTAIARQRRKSVVLVSLEDWNATQQMIRQRSLVRETAFERDEV